MFHRVSYFLVQRIVGNKSACDDEQKAIYVYGLECILVTGVPALFLVLIGILTRSLEVITIWISLFFVSRHKAGGYHAGTDLKCMTMSCLLGMVNCLWRYLVNIPKFILASIVVINLMIFFLFAPFESKKITLTSREKSNNKIALLFLSCVNLVFIWGMPIKIAVTFTYALLCCSLLLIMGKIFR